MSGLPVLGRGFQRLWIAYSLAVAIFFGVLTCSWEFRGAEKQQLSMENEVRSQADTLLQNMEHKLEQFIYLSSNLREISWLKHTMSDAPILQEELPESRKLEICQELRMHMNAFQAADSLCVVFPRRGLVVDTATWWTMESHLRSIGIWDEAEIARIMAACRSNEQEHVFGVDADQSGLMLIRRIDETDVTRAKLVMFISDTKLSQYMMPNNIKRLPGLRILADGEVVYQYSGARSSDGKELRTFTMHSKLADLTYEVTLACDTSGLHSGLAYALLVLLSILLGVFCGYLLARISYRPIEKLLKHLNINLEKGQSEYEIIAREHDALLADKRNLTQMAGEYLNAAKSGLLTHLLYGDYNDDNLDHQLRTYRVAFGRKDCFRILNTLGNSEATASEDISDFLRLCDLLGEGKLSYEIIERKDKETVVLLCHEDEQELIRQSDELLAVITRELSDVFEVYASDVVHGVGEINLAYQRLKEGVKSLAGAQEGQHVESYYYPLDWEIQFIKDLRMGKYVVVNRLLDAIYSENLHMGVKDACLVDLIWYIVNTLERLYREMGLDTSQLRAMFQPLCSNANHAEAWDLLKQKCNELAQRILDTHKIVSNEKAAAIKRYVDEHYCDYAISQQNIASELGMTPSAVSKLFKNAYGQNFLDYVQNLRIREAKRMMDEGETSVSVLAKTVGYENDITFKRAFQKVMMMTPRTYMIRLRK